MTHVKMALRITPVLLLLGLAVLLLTPTHQTPIPVVRASSVTINLVGNLSGWNNGSSVTNPTLRITQGDTVSISLTSTDITHQFALDVDQDGQKVTGMCPTGDTCSNTFSPGYPTSISLTSTFTAGLTPGTYKYFCTFHSNMVGDFIVQSPPPDYSLSSNPTSLTISQGSSGISTITAMGTNGFMGTVSLTAAVSPAGPTASLSPTSVSITGPSMTSTLTVQTTGTTPSGTYTVTVSGNNGTVTRTTSVSVTVTVPDFTITASPTSLSIKQNSTGTTTITLSSLNGFSGTISLSATASPSGLGLSFSSTTVGLTSGGTATSTLTVSAVGTMASPVGTGSYSITISATNGTLSHSTAVQTTVTPPNSSPPGGLNLSPTILVGAGAVILVAVVVTIIAVRRKK